MAQTITVAHHPELTPVNAMEIFQKYFGSKYRVRKIRRTIARDFIICKSAMVGARIKLKQKGNTTSFILDSDASNAILAVCFWVFLGILPALINAFILSLFSG